MSVQPETETFVCRYAGLRIMRDEDGDLFAENGCDVAAEAAESLEDAKAQIDDYWAGTEHGPLNGVFTGADL